ncbi:peptidoglycan-binding domain-containing protein [Kitasatospora sp. NPDC049285]|uniref:peptidoglycan-binding domain-containing protein n=1 Tax=Kitasatospora sp. NPDC049285 TaxID=3157096 RepID=UPI003414F32C
MRDEYVNLLLSQDGVHEGQNADGTWNNHQRYSAETPGLEWSQDQPWCATFEAWGAHQLGMDQLWPMTASCLTAVDWWQQHGRWTQYPVLGGPFYLGDGGGAHTGVVVGYDADNIFTIEGNTSADGRSAWGDGVHQRTRPRRGPSGPYGYGVPAYPEGIISADPALGGVPAAHVNTVTGQPAPAPTPAPPAAPAYPQWPGRYLRVQSPMLHGDDVRQWQQQMAARRWSIDMDGWYGPQSAGVCRAFQQEKGLVVDGIVGPVTWAAAWTAPRT